MHVDNFGGSCRFGEGIKPGTERNGTGSNLVLIIHTASPCASKIAANIQASELIYMEGNFVTRDSTKQRENASEGAEQAVTIQYNTAWIPMIPQPKQFCYHGHSTYSTVETLTISSLASQARTHRRVLSAWWSPQSQYHFQTTATETSSLIPVLVKRYKRGEISTAT